MFYWYISAIIKIIVIKTASPDVLYLNLVLKNTKKCHSVEDKLSLIRK